MGWRRFPIIAAGLLASAVFMYLAVRRLDFAALREVWAGAHVFPWIPLGILSYVAGHVVRGQRCRLLVRREANLRLPTASNIVVVGYASNNVFPARLGELVRAGMLAERSGIPLAQSLVVTFIERVLDGLAIILLLVLGSWRQDAASWTHDVVRAGLVVFGSAAGVMLLGVLSPGFVLTVASRLGAKLGEKWHDRLVSLATSITNAGACLRDPRDAAQILALSVVVWMLEAGLFIAILPAFGLSGDAATGAVAMSVTNLGLLVPSSPGFVGPFHFFCSRALVANGVPEATALAYAAVVHLAFYIPVTLWGAGAMLWYGVEVGATAAMARAARTNASRTIELNGVKLYDVATLAAAPADRPASEFMIALVESVVVPQGTTTDREVVVSTANFVEGQIAALDARLGFLFECGMTMFRFVTRLRYLRGYCDLSLDTRRAWTRAWAESRYALFRQLFRPIRGISLLAYHEHPKVHAALVATPAKVVPPTRLVREKAASSPSPAETS